jgi:hypothetical protein
MVGTVQRSPVHAAGKMDGERDRNGAIIQPKSSGGTMPYAWFFYRPGYHGETPAKLFDLKPRPTRSLRP